MAAQYSLSVDTLSTPSKMNGASHKSLISGQKQNDGPSAFERHLEQKTKQGASTPDQGKLTTALQSRADAASAGAGPTLKQTVHNEQQTSSFAEEALSEQVQTGLLDAERNSSAIIDGPTVTAALQGTLSAAKQSDDLSGELTEVMAKDAEALLAGTATIEIPAPAIDDQPQATQRVTPQAPAYQNQLDGQTVVSTTENEIQPVQSERVVQAANTARTAQQNGQIAAQGNDGHSHHLSGELTPNPSQSQPSEAWSTPPQNGVTATAAEQSTAAAAVNTVGTSTAMSAQTSIALQTGKVTDTEGQGNIASKPEYAHSNPDTLEAPIAQVASVSGTQTDEASEPEISGAATDKAAQLTDKPEVPTQSAIIQTGTDIDTAHPAPPQQEENPIEVTAKRPSVVSTVSVTQNATPTQDLQPQVDATNSAPPAEVAIQSLKSRSSDTPEIDAPTTEQPAQASAATDAPASPPIIQSQTRSASTQSIEIAPLTSAPDSPESKPQVHASRSAGSSGQALTEQPTARMDMGSGSGNSDSSFSDRSQGEAGNIKENASKAQISPAPKGEAFSKMMAMIDSPSMLGETEILVDKTSQSLTIDSQMTAQTATVRLTGTEALARTGQLPQQVSLANSNAIATEISKFVQKDETRFEIRLDPADLGKIDVRLSVSTDGSTRAHLMVERPETLDMLMRDQRFLERSLQQNGVALDNQGIEYSLMDQGQSNSQMAGQDREFSGENPDARQDQQDNEHAAQTASTPASTGHYSASSGLNLVI